MYRNQVSPLYTALATANRLICGSLAYCEMYVMLGNFFRRFDNLKGNELTEADRAVNDYISSGLPPTATRFHVSPGEKVA